MPVMNGYEATKLIKENIQNAHTPIIALTAGNVKGEKEKCLQAGMSDFVAKPIVENNIVELFNKWLSATIDTEIIVDTQKNIQQYDTQFDIKCECSCHSCSESSSWRCGRCIIIVNE